MTCLKLMLLYNGAAMEARCEEIIEFSEFLVSAF
jgi:hypothetical protein